MHDITGTFAYQKVFDIMKTKFGKTPQYFEELLFNIECILDDDPDDQFFWGNHAGRFIFDEAYPDCPYDDDNSECSISDCNCRC